jgi:hypothetical protein
MRRYGHRPLSRICFGLRVERGTCRKQLDPVAPHGHPLGCEVDVLTARVSGLSR